jgi:hypothetical protein
MLLAVMVPLAHGALADDRGAVGRAPTRISRNASRRAADLAVRLTPSPRLRLSDGVTLQRLRLPGPLQVRVLRVAPKSSARLDVASAGPAGTYARTSTMARHEHALAAVNGDFAVYPGYAVHPVLVDGTLRASGYRHGAMVGAGPDGRTFLGHAGPHVWLTSAGDRLALAGVNIARPLSTDVELFSAAGGHLVRPPRDACSVRLLPAKGAGWTQMGALRHHYRVDKSVCGAAALSLDGGIVLATSRTSAHADALRAMSVGTVVDLHTSLGWPGVTDALGGMPMLVRGGLVLPRAGCTDPFCIRQPRTAVGRTANGTLLLVTVDGRLPGWSTGLTLHGLALLMTQLHAVSALNLDGGGGTTMWVHGHGLVNHPSDAAGERLVTNAILILPRSDDPAGLAAASHVLNPEAGATW